MALQAAEVTKKIELLSGESGGQRVGLKRKAEGEERGILLSQMVLFQISDPQELEVRKDQSLHITYL